MASVIWQQTAEPTKTGNFLESQGILAGFVLVNSGRMAPLFLFGAEKPGFFCAIRTKNLKQRSEGRRQAGAGENSVSQCVDL